MGPTMTDVAREAGVGLATVDRVINKRASVSQETAERVLAAAEKLGFRRASLIRDRLDERTAGYRLGFILQKSSTHFYSELGSVLEATTRTQMQPAGKALVAFLDELTPEHVVAKLYELGKKVDAIALVAADHPLVSQAIDDITARGIPVFALISDLTAVSCSGYVGIDHRKVGRTAAWAISTISPAPGKVGVIVGSHRYLCQEQSEMSFRSYFREFAPQFQVLETLISLEDIHLAQSATLELLKQHPDLTGIYIAGGGIEGVLQALKDGNPPPGLVTVCLDLTAVTRQALIERRINMVLSHPQEWLASRLVEAMVAAIQDKAARGSLQNSLPFITYTPANV
ncbi:LacI family DNA-binding transcriptional regulator [Vogesella indigofera]|uniref:LacI family DNA-binding transcriptional regulator n=1 Tax=Vogesella indigofera TaxID=45465 RepID=UPI00234E4FA7|nr:LacI family DNA-binding transcriptional regulator [Vogesella indigofera]MDC7699687.1 LacI family DNA-binding transcriptional regulator [Vogesella indigofera]